MVEEQKMGEDYCPHINICVEARRELCYSLGYKACSFYEANVTIVNMRKEKDKGLTKRIQEKLGNPNDENRGQL
jgi:hypothetical protein